MQAVGGAVLLRKGSLLDLSQSSFASNFANYSHDDGFGIVSLGGKVQCDAFGCLPVCTSCSALPLTPQPTAVGANDVRSLTPSPSALQPRPSTDATVASTKQRRRSSGTTKGSATFLWPLSGLVFGVLVFGLVVWRRRLLCFGRGAHVELQADSARAPPIQQPFLRPDDNGTESHGSGSEAIHSAHLTVTRSYSEAIFLPLDGVVQVRLARARLALRSQELRVLARRGVRGRLPHHADQALVHG